MIIAVCDNMNFKENTILSSLTNTFIFYCTLCSIHTADGRCPCQNMFVIKTFKCHVFLKREKIKKTVTKCLSGDMFVCNEAMVLLFRSTEVISSLT